MLEAADGGPRTHVVVEVAEIGDLPGSPEARVTWLVRRPGGRPGVRALAAVREAGLPPGPGYAWVAGEAGMVRAVRRHLRAPGLPRERLYTCGYWRQGESAYPG